MKYFKNICFLLIAFSVFSCYVDKDNYSYKDLPKFSIDSLDVYNYVKLRSELLEITPVVEYDGNQEDLEFLWTIYSKDMDRDTNLYFSDTLSKKNILNYTVNLPVNKYIVNFIVYNKLLDTKQFMSFNLDVQSDFSKGWMLLVSREDGDDIDFIKTNKFFPDIKDEKVYKNIFSLANKGRKITNGKFLIQDYLSDGDGDIYMLEENGGGQLSPIDCSIKNNYDKFFIAPSDATKPTAIGFFKNTRRVLISNEKVYCSWGSASYGPLFGPSLLSDEKKYKATSFVLSTENRKAVIYDELNHRFLRISPYDKGKVSIYKDALPKAIFDMNNIGMDVVHMEKGFNGYACNIFKELGTSNHHLYIINIEEYDNQTPIAKYSMKNCTDIAKASCFAFGTRGNVCYYTVDNKIYQYDYSGANNDSELKHEFTAGEKIVSMKVYKDMSEKINSLLDSKVLVVATYNESTKAGKVYMFDIQETNGDISKNGIKSYDIDGKVIDMGIKN